MKNTKRISTYAIFFVLVLTLTAAFSSCSKREKIGVSSKINSVTEAEYYSGDIDGNLKKTLTVGIDERVYFVIDYTLSGVDKIAEDTVATFRVNFETETDGYFGRDYCTIKLEETPTTDYTVSDRGYTYDLNVQIYSGDKTDKSYRFIFSVSKSKIGKLYCASVLMLPEIDGKEIYDISGNARSEGTATVDGSIITESKLAFAPSGDGTYYTVTGLGSEIGDTIEIPENYKGLPVKEIGDNAFRDVAYLKKITVPKTVTRIGANAFRSCAALEEMRIPLTVTEIGSDAFADCPDMHVRCEAAEKPSGWEESSVSGVSCITWGCDILFEFMLSYDGTYYSMVKSEGVSGEVVIPSIYYGLPVTVLDKTFYGCGEITNVTIPDSITEINSWAFSGCFGLTSINIPDSVTLIGMYAFNGCTSLESVIIPDSVTYIVGDAFRDCSGLTSVEIGLGVTRIDPDAFKGCNNLKSVTFKDTSTWYYEPFNSITGKQTQIDVTDPKRNAANLTINYTNCYWEKK